MYSRPLESGDIINLDVSVYLDGFHGDTSKTFLVGDVDTEGKRLIDVTTRALEESIDKCCTPRSPFRSIGEYIEELARNEKFSIVKEYTGHGIGEEFHCLPFILHHRNYERGQMLPGMAFTIEPILCEGSSQVCAGKLFHFQR
jgi:methionyl aminopeptidase